MLKNYGFASLISLATILFSFFVPAIFQDITGLIGVFTIGILHGANDMLILSKKVTHPSKNTFIKTLSLYISVVLLGGFLFFYVSEWALLAFVLVSCFHFGEQHWEPLALAIPLQGFFYFCYGGLIFFLLFFIKHVEVNAVILQITGFEISRHIFLIGLLVFAGFFYTFLVSLKVLHSKIVSESLLLLFLAIIFQLSSLVFGFAFYFVVWHSIPSLKSQLRYLYPESTSHSFLKYLKSSAIYWVMALIGMITAYYFLDFKASYFLPLFFSFLAAITFPHVIVMWLMFRSTAQESGLKP